VDTQQVAEYVSDVLGVVYAAFFDAAYRDLADKGRADEPGGAEYRRVKDEWIAAGCPKNVSSFICKAANRPPRLHDA